MPRQGQGKAQDQRWIFAGEDGAYRLVVEAAFDEGDAADLVREVARRAEDQLVVMPGTACLSTKTAGRRILRECNLTTKATVPSSSAMPGLSLRSP